MAEEALDDEEQDEEECPKCPPVGACVDGDICRYGDASYGFFVLILSFAEFNVPKFKQISGSLKAFGVQEGGSSCRAAKGYNGY